MFSAFDKVFTLDNLLILVKGAAYSLGLAALALLIGLAFAVLLAACRLSKNKILNFISNAYVEIIRGIPMYVLITYIFVVVPLLINHVTGQTVRPNVYFIGIIALSLNSAAYQAEYIRSGINGVSKGQWEACDTLGLSRRDTLRFIILPQAFKLIIPTIVSEFVTLIKDSSLLASIGAVELFQTAKNIGNTYYEFMSPYTIIIFYYLFMTMTISYLAKRLERKLSESD